VSAVLQRLESESANPLSAQGEINALVILARRTRDPWLPEQQSRATAILAKFRDKQNDLNEGQKCAVGELASALNRLGTNVNVDWTRPHASVGSKGFCYLGKFAGDTWKTQYVRFNGDHLPNKGDVGTVSYPVHLRDKASTDGAQLGIAQIGQMLRIDEVDKHAPDLFWARVTVTQ
jgi:hypothetical protein